MRREVENKNRNSTFNGSYVGGNNITNTIMFEDKEREFVVTHNADIKPTSYFTGRETELQELRQKIEEKKKSVLVSGMGGIGKTHICRKLFEEYYIKYEKAKNQPFHHIGYIEYSGDMESSLQNCLKYKKQDNPEQNKEAAWRELEDLAADGKLLLFVDNVNVSIGEDAGLERLKSLPGAVVLTSRRASFSKAFEPYRIGFLSTEQCREIYERIRYEGSGKKVAEEEVPDLEYVIEKLAAGHTITVEFLANLARSKTKPWSVKRLRKELEEKGFCLEYIDEEDKLVNIQNSYETLYDLSALTEAEQNILEAFSVFPYIPLHAEVCNRWLLADAEVGEDIDIFVGLYRKGWLQFDMEQECYSLHPVFAQFIYEKCKPKLEKHVGLIKECIENLEIPENGSALECQYFIPFAEAIVEKMDMGKGEEQADLIDALANLLQYVSEYKKAEKLYVNLTEICKEIFGEEHPSTATSYNNLAGVYDSQGEYGKAEELHQKSLQIRDKVLGEEHPDTAVSYNNLAAVYNRQGKYREAEELYKRSLQIRERILGDEHLDTAISYNNLALVYNRQRKYGEAEELCKKSLQIREKVLGEGHPDTATSYNNLAVVYEGQGKYGEAEELYKRSLQISEKVLGAEHPDTAISYSNLAGVYEEKGKYGEAKALYKKSLQICKKVLGEGHPDTATNYNNLAGVYESQGEYEKAEELYQKSLQIREKALGEEHPSIAASYNNLAGVYAGQGRCKLALAYYIRAYKILIHKFGENHPHIQIIYGNMETAYTEYHPEGNFEQWLEEKMREQD